MTDPRAGAGWQLRWKFDQIVYYHSHFGGGAPLPPGLGNPGSTMGNVGSSIEMSELSFRCNFLCSSIAYIRRIGAIVMSNK